MSAETYVVFKRKVYTRADGKWIPNPRRGQAVQTGLTLEEARALCATGPANIARDAGTEYRGLTFYEFTREGREV